MAAKKASLAKNSMIANTIDSSVSNLETALAKVDKSVAALSKESKKLLSESRRMRKRRASLMGKKKRATAANKKNPSATARKLVKSVTSELASTGKAVAKATASRSVVTDELAGLKQSQKMLSAYMTGIASADRKLAKASKKKRKTRKKRKAA